MKPPPYLALLQALAAERKPVPDTPDHLLAGDQLTAGPGATHGSVISDHSLLPPGMFLQSRGPRAGQRFRVKRGESGQAIRLYEGGDTALAGTPLHQVSSPQIGPQRSPDPSLQDAPVIAELIRRFAAGRQ